MSSESLLATYLAASPYSVPVDIKKLEFLFSAITEYASRRGKELHDLSVLEVGCARGGITIPLTTLGCQVTAFDIDSDAVADLRSKLNDVANHRVALSVDNGYTFDDGRLYDIVIVSEVIEHVLEPVNFARNIVRRMMRKASLVVTIPNGYGPWEMKNRLNPRVYLRKWNLLRRLLGKPPYVWGNGLDHCQFYSKPRLVGLFSSLSCKLVCFKNSDSLLAVFNFARRNSYLAGIDIKLADSLPYWLASGWFAVFEFQGE
jgi:2-polyprenyl-3-methyl-5-hydroxy-6-metoxy-1,4-benzoquinol methylase